MERYKSNVAVGLLLIKDNKILLQKRQNTGYMDGMYDASCSGHIEKNETLKEAVIREAKEELGIDVDEKDLKLATIIHTIDENYFNFYFTTENYKGIPQIIEKEFCEELEWFNRDNLPDNVFWKVKKIVENMEKGIILS